METHQYELELERMKGDIKLIRQSIHTIEFNHLKHIQESVSSIYRILGAIGFVLFGQLCIVVRQLLIG
jgi:hypothetical protein